MTELRTQPQHSLAERARYLGHPKAWRRADAVARSRLAERLLRDVLARRASDRSLGSGRDAEVLTLRASALSWLALAS